MANFINKYLNQSAYDADNTKQYPNTSLVGNDIVFAMAAPTPAFGGLTVKYQISQEATQYEVSLFNGGGASSGSSESKSGGGGALPTTMIVDGVSETPINSWRFTTAGEHTVQYTFNLNTVPSGFITDNVSTAKDVIVGTGITAISTGAFDAALTSATCLSTTPPTLGDNTVFGSQQNYPIYVPASAVETYQTSTATGWSEYASRIQAIQ